MILIDDQIPILAEYFAKKTSVLVFDGRTITNSTIRDVKATALFVRSTTQVNSALLDGTEVTFVGSATAGTDHVDDAWLRARGIRFASAPASNAWAVAEYVYGWLQELQVRPSSTIGIIGHGNVGMRLVMVLQRAGYLTQVYDPPKYNHTPEVLDQLLATSDAITLHIPLTRGGLHPTAAMLSASRIAMIKPGAVLIQTSRGGVVNEAAVLERVRDGALRAVFDVFSNEPNVSQEFVSTVMNCTPHIAGYSKNAKLMGAIMVAEAYLQEQIPVLRESICTPTEFKAAGGNEQVSDAFYQSSIRTLRNVALEAAWFCATYNPSLVGHDFDTLRKQYIPLTENLSMVWCNSA